MKPLVVLLALLAAGICFYPLYAEGTGSACAAFERRARMLATAELERTARETGNPPRLQQVLSLLQGSAPTGLLADTYIRNRFPELPPALACTAGYGKTMQNPDLTQLVAALKR